MEGNITERLRGAGLIDDAKAPLPPEYYDFLETLSEEEVGVLVRLKQRLDDAGIPSQILTTRSLVPVL
jgi:hypothetical protein